MRPLTTRPPSSGVGRPRARPRSAPPATAALPASDHAAYLADVARVPPPPDLAAVLALLTEGGEEGRDLTAPTDREGVHPYVVPLAVDAGGGVVGLLRRPGDDAGRALAIVSAPRRAARLTLLARTPAEFVAAAALEADAARAGTPRAAADAARVKAACLAPAVAERLVTRHVDRGDTMSALIAAEWYMRRGHFPGWGRPYDYAASLLAATARPDEARDCARVALALPWWSLARPVGELAAAARLGGGARGRALAAAVKAALEAAEAGAGGLPPVTNRTDAQAAVDAATGALDDAVAEEGEGGEGGVEWARAAAVAADALEGGGLAAVAAFVRGAAA